MRNYHSNIVSGLKAAGCNNVYYELAIDDSSQLPFVSYLEVSNIDNTRAQTLANVTDSNICSYQLKIVAHNISDILTLFSRVDTVMKGMYFVRTGAIESVDNKTGLIYKILTYRKTN